MKGYIIKLLSENRTLKIYFSNSEIIGCTKLVNNIDKDTIEVTFGESIISYIINVNNVCYVEVS